MHPASETQTARNGSGLTVRRAISWTIFLALVCLSAYGFYSAYLFAQYIWTPTGIRRLILFAAAYGACAAAWIVWRSRWLPAAALVLAGAYTIAAVGAVAPAAVAAILFSSWMLGRLIRRTAADENDPLALPLGLAVWTAAVSLAVYFPVNYPIVYAAALAVPVLWKPRQSLHELRRITSEFSRIATTTRTEAAALAALGFALATQWLVVLKPEAGADGLAFHLVIPAQVAMRHYWAFDFRQFTWALMPLAGDWAHTLAYLLGGEYAARLLNFSFLAILCALLLGATHVWASRPAALFLAALFVSTPLVQLETGSLFVENFWAMLLLSSLLALAKFREAGDVRDLAAACVLLGSTLAVKFGALAFAVPALAFVCIVIHRRPRRTRNALLALFLFVALAAPPYVNAYRLTGNPVYPFFNQVFHSPYFDSTTELRNQRYTTPLSWRTPWELTFHSSRYLESQDGSLGFHYLWLVPLALVMLRRSSDYLLRVSLAVAIVGFVITFAGQSYLRYIYPALPLLTMAMALAEGAASGMFRRALWAAMVSAFALNLYFLASSSWYHKDFFLNPFRPAELDTYLKLSAPARRLVDYLNRKGGDPHVAFLGDDAIGDLRGQPYADSWHSYRYFQMLNTAGSPKDELRAAHSLGIDWFIAPTPESGIVLVSVHLRAFLDQFTTPEYTFGKYYLARLRPQCQTDECAPLVATGPPSPAPPGSYEDTGARLVWQGPWSRGQFPLAAGGTVTYSSSPASQITFQFTGTAVTWVYTQATNRGRASVQIDSKDYGVLDQYAPTTIWQSNRTFDALPPGAHTLTIRVLGEKSPQSSAAFIDLDSLVVR